MNDFHKHQTGQPKENTIKEIRYQLVGWWLFILCAVFFIASAIKNKDVFTLVGSIIFLIACIVFILPLRKKK